MSDEDLLDYFEIHSRTERALFHRDMVVRLFELADEEPSGLGNSKWIAVRSDLSGPLVKRAREKMDVNTARYILIAGFVPDGVARATSIHQSIAMLARYAYEENQRMRQELEGFRKNGRVLRTLITLVRGIPSVVALLKKLDETGGSIPSCDWGPADDDTVERRAETLLKTIDGTYPSRELTREELRAL